MSEPGSFLALRAALGQPYEYDPYDKALQRAEEECAATTDAALVWLRACIETPSPLGLSELLFWVGQAHFARKRLHEQRARKRRS